MRFSNKFLVAILAAFGILVIGCDHEVLKDVTVYHVKVYSEDGRLKSEGTLFLEFVPTTRPPTYLPYSFEYDVTGTWKWSKRMNDGTLSGVASGITADNGELAVYLSQSGEREDYQMALEGKYTGNWLVDFEGRVYEDTGEGLKRTSDSFYAKFISSGGA